MSTTITLGADEFQRRILEEKSFNTRDALKDAGADTLVIEGDAVFKDCTLPALMLDRTTFTGSLSFENTRMQLLGLSFCTLKQDLVLQNTRFTKDEGLTLYRSTIEGWAICTDPAVAFQCFLAMGGRVHCPHDSIARKMYT